MSGFDPRTVSIRPLSWNSEQKIKMKTLITIITVVLLVGCRTTQLPLNSEAAKSGKTGASTAQPIRDTRQADPHAGSALVDAARVGNLEAAKQHLVAGADVDFRNQQGFTPLHVAAQKGHNKVAELLIAKGANVNTSGRLIGTTPLDSAALLGHKEMVELLIDSGADINPQITTGETPLQRAEQRGHSAIAEILRKHGGKAGEVTLQLAILKGQKDVAKSLITGGADVNAKGLLGRTPLDWAIIGGKNELAALLRKHGGKRGEELKTAEPFPEATILEPPIAKTTGIPIIEAIRKGNIEAVKQHLAAGMDVNGRDNWGRTVLHKASGWQGQREIVELLISNGADVNAKRSDGAIPLHYAVYYDRMENVEILLSKGADLNAKDGDQNGATPLHEAAWRSRKEIVDLLISKGADVNDKDNEGQTPLDLAVQHKRTDNIDLLRKHGGKTAKELKAAGN